MGLVQRNYRIDEEQSRAMQRVVDRANECDPSRTWTVADFVRWSLSLGLSTAESGFKYGQPPGSGPSWPRIAEATWDRYAEMMELPMHPGHSGGDE